MGLLKFLYGEALLFPDTFKTEWENHTIRMNGISSASLEVVKRILLDAYQSAFSEQSFSSLVTAKVNLNFSSIERVVLDMLQNYADTHRPNRPRGRSILRILHETSQKILFGHLSPDQRNDETVVAAVLENMQKAITNGIHALIEEPLARLEGQDKAYDDLQAASEKS